MRCHLPSDNYFIGKDLPEPYSNYTIDSCIGKGNNALVYKIINNQINGVHAFKFIPDENLPEESDLKEEILKANQVNDDMVVKHYNTGRWDDGEIKGHYIISDYVDGKNLEEYIKQYKEDISIAFIINFLKAMLSLQFQMERYGVKHGDLHARNILVQRENAIDGVRMKFKIIDFGVARLFSTASNIDDYEQCAQIMYLLLGKIKKSKLESKDKFYYDRLRGDFGKILTDKDNTRNITQRNPKALFTYLNGLVDSYDEAELARMNLKLLTPFDFLSCEQIGESHSILNSLYSDKFLGLSDIESRSNLVLTGPRGCGKSTVFKCLSLKHRMLINNDTPDAISYIGVYYRCDDLWAHFQRYKITDRDETYDIPLHFMISSLLQQLLSDVFDWSSKYFTEEFIKKESIISEKICNILCINNISILSFDAILQRLKKQRTRSAREQKHVHITSWEFKNYYGVNSLSEICNCLTSELSFLSRKPIYFFIDDYSAPKITEDLQSNLNRLIMQRTPDCFFKISTESPVSFSRKDIDGKQFVEGREFKLLNLASIFLQADSGQILEFIEDVFSRRFAAVDDYPVKELSELIGENVTAFEAHAREIRQNGKAEIWGKQALGYLCSGDIFYIISLVEKMVTMAGGAGKLLESSPKIPPRVQYKVIRDEAGLFLRSLGSIQNGEHLVEVVNVFGKVAHSYLKFKNSQNEKISTIHQASKIEPLETLALSPKAESVYKELLRYSIFFQDTRGKSQRGNVVPRLYLRRCLIPFFNLSFKKRDSIRMENDDIELLLTAPHEYQKKAMLPKSKSTQEEDLFKHYNVKA